MGDPAGDVRRGLIERLVGRLGLRFPTLFAVFLAITLVDLLVPDCLPFVDEIGFALLALMFGLWKDRREPPAGPSEPGRGPDEAIPVGRGSTRD